MEIFIANLHPDIEEDVLAKLFEVFGPVTSTVLVRDKETRISRGYGFIIMQNAIDAQRAIDDLNGRELAGNVLSVKPSEPKEKKPAEKKPNDYVTVSFKGDESVKTIVKSELEEEMPKEEEKEEPSTKLIDEASFTKSVDDTGMIKISFNK